MCAKGCAGNRGGSDAKSSAVLPTALRQDHYLCHLVQEETGSEFNDLPKVTWPVSRGAELAPELGSRAQGYSPAPNLKI